MAEWNGWLQSRFRAYIWKQWKKPQSKYHNLLKLGIPEKNAWMTAMSKRGHWFVVSTTSMGRAISKEKLASAGYPDLSLAYESIHSDCIGRAVYQTVRTMRLEDGGLSPPPTQSAGDIQKAVAPFDDKSANRHSCGLGRFAFQQIGE